ncbi:ALF repeat-containing protein, partial [Streptomyces sp. NPDC050803]|uniref:ALF repeat-containing protein n=1 Tax=Streptomyces sp. NPDC050803 TaxID=3154635 RepID=UPI0034278B35
SPRCSRSGTCAATNAAAAANAAADAATSAGVAQSQAAKAREAAAEADAAAARATRAASTAQTLANRAAAAARVARDAARSAADHADAAADAADEAAANAGKAIEYAKRSTAYAAAAVEAATTASNAVKEAQEVEQAARVAEAALIAQDTELGIEEAVLRAQAEIADTERINRERTQADKTATEIKDLIAAAETALSGGDSATAVSTGRKAAVKLLDSVGTWTREAAEFALAGTDESVLNWIDADRVLAQRQDDRETVLAVAKASTASVADAAHRALASDDPDATAAFLTQGAVEAAQTDYRVAVLKILNENPGTAVRAKAEAALDDGSATALYRFFTVELPAAVKEDDRVEILRLLDAGGPYTKAAAQIALDGPTRMRRYFVIHDKFVVARLDHDHATHVAAVRAAIAHAARVAAKALEDAALASKAAAEARQAAAEASEWAAKAKGYATDAANSAQQAQQNADAADKSAADAAQSAESAKQAASVARSSARSANYSMRQAMASAEQAVSYASSAQNSAAQAQASADQAGQDSQAAADAASQAQETAAELRQAELEAAAQAAAEAAQQNEANGTDPSQTADQDNPFYVDWGLWPEDVEDPKDWAKVTGHWATILGTAGTVCSLIPGLQGLGLGLSIASWGISGVSTILNGVGYGCDSAEFKSSLGQFLIGGIFLGKGWMFKKAGIADEIGVKVSETVGGVVESVIGVFDW